MYPVLSLGDGYLLSRPLSVAQCLSQEHGSWINWQRPRQISSDSRLPAIQVACAPCSQQNTQQCMWMRMAVHAGFGHLLPWEQSIRKKDKSPRQCSSLTCLPVWTTFLGWGICTYLCIVKETSISPFHVLDCVGDLIVKWPRMRRAKKHFIHTYSIS